MCDKCLEAQSTGVRIPSNQQYGGGMIQQGEPSAIKIIPGEFGLYLGPQKPKEFYCLPGQEQMQATVHELYERDIEPTYDIDYQEPIEIEVWSVASNERWMPSIDDLLDLIARDCEGMEIDEYWWEKFENALGHPEVRTKVQELRQLIAGKIDYWMADKHIDTKLLRINYGHPTFDGEPVYKREALI